MRITITGYKWYDWERVKPEIVKKNMVFFYREENERGQDGFAYRAECKGGTLGHLPDPRTIMNIWSRPDKKLADYIQKIRDCKPDSFKAIVVEKHDTHLVVEPVKGSMEWGTK